MCFTQNFLHLKSEMRIVKFKYIFSTSEWIILKLKDRYIFHFLCKEIINIWTCFIQI